MKVVVTGATGFLGGHVVARLLAEGHEVVALGRNAGIGSALGTRFIAADLSQFAGLLAGESADGFVHAAALSSNWGPREAFWAANVEGTQQALMLARRLGVRRFVHVSSPSIYFRFADQLDVSEDMALPKPVNAYAWSKAAAERLVLAAADLGPVILRPRGLYGRGDTALLPRLLRAAKRGPLPLLRDGAAVTDLTHVEDVAGAVLAGLDAGPQAEGGVYNISGGEPMKVTTIAEMAARKAGTDLRWRPMPTALALGGARAMEAVSAMLPGRPEPVVTAYSLGIFAFSQTLDIARARTMLDWTPRVGFAEGLERS